MKDRVEKKYSDFLGRMFGLASEVYVSDHGVRSIFPPL